MNAKERWLQKHLKRETLPLEEGEKECIDCLRETNISENDVSSCIDVLEVLLSLDALPSLLNIVEDATRSTSLRKRAAKAISVIGSDYVESELAMLRAAASPEMCLLSEIALGIRQ